MHRCAVLALALCALLAFASPASAVSGREVHRVVAYGEGVTTCEITLYRDIVKVFSYAYHYNGSTSCSTAVQQTGFGWTELHDDDGNFCSGFRTTCGSGGESFGEVAHYDVTITAPRGQGWVTVPEDCSGVGTDNLRCNFAVHPPLYVT